jgi:4-hydroxy-2-oxoheptanedioate aldolase
MTVYAAFADRLRRGDSTFTAWVGWPEPMVAGALAQAGYDAVTLDMQHGAIDYLGVVRSIPPIMAADRPAVVRIPVGEFATASRLLDAGASAIIAPMVNSAADAEALVAFTKLPPVGQRSWSPYAALPLSGLNAAAYLAGANALVRVFAMVETREALAALDDILAVDGIDGIFVGPSDLSIALSEGAQVDAEAPAVEEALDHVVARCRAAGKVPGVYAITAQRAKALAARGFVFIAVGSDGLLLHSAARQAIGILRG